jgi:hypothetical protein
MLYFHTFGKLILIKYMEIYTNILLVFSKKEQSQQHYEKYR